MTTEQSVATALGAYLSVTFALGVARSFFEGRGDHGFVIDPPGLLFLWPLAVLVIAVHGPFVFAQWLGEKSAHRRRLKAAAREAEAEHSSPRQVVR